MWCIVWILRILFFFSFIYFNMSHLCLCLGAVQYGDFWLVCACFDMKYRIGDFWYPWQRFFIYIYIFFLYTECVIHWHWCFYLHRSRDLVSPVCGIFYFCDKTPAGLDRTRQNMRKLGLNIFPCFSDSIQLFELIWSR